MKCEWMLFCDYAFVDAGQKTCLIGIFDRIYAPQVPAVHPQLAIAAKVRGEKGEEGRMRLEIIRPTLASLSVMEGEVKLGDSDSADIRLGILGLNLPDYGDYTVKLYFDGVAARSLTLSVLPPPQPVPVQ